MKAKINTGVDILNLRTWFMTNILLELEMIKLLNKWHFVENTTDYVSLP
jgi:hypothetical protein